MPACKHLEPHEVNAVLEAFSGYTENRDKALFVVGLMTGFRISELCAITVKDVVSGGDIKTDLTVAKRNMKGKMKSRTVPLNEIARGYIRNAVEDLQRRGFLAPDTPLFRSVRKTGNAVGRSQAYRIIVTKARKAGVSGAVGTHSMRKTFAHNAHQHHIARLSRGEQVNPLVEASKALGHGSIQNTVSYLPASQVVFEETFHAVADRVRIPPAYEKDTA